MVAGESAREIARRRRQKAERLAQSAAAWERGAEGESVVGEKLDGLPAGWIVLHDRPWPGRERANLDHVVIGPAGVFVIDAKNWAGSVTLNGSVLRQNGYRRESAIDSAQAAAVALGKALGPEFPVPVPVLCFVSDEAPRGNVRGVLLCGITDLEQMLITRRHVLLDEQVERAAHAVRWLVRQETSPQRYISRRPTVRPSVKRPRTATTRRPRRRSVKGQAARLIFVGVGALLLAANPEVVSTLAAALPDLLINAVSE